jgi:hypothetical protein
MSDVARLSRLLRRVWRDIDALRQADPRDLELARLEALEQLDREAIARTARLDQLQAALNESNARAAHLRHELGEDG